MPTREDLFRAAQRLYAHLWRSHLCGGLLRGPDPGVRLNLRLWRFAKSYLRFLPWHDHHVFMQSQGYWVLCNWALHEATAESRYRKAAIQTTEAILLCQTSAGFWPYPLPERRHLVATVEGNWAAIGLLASYQREPRKEYLDGAGRWYDYLVRRIGFQKHSSGEAVNYFDQPRGKVTNNSVEAAWLFLRLWRATGDARFLEHVDPLLDFIAAAQLASGELPYTLAGTHEKDRPHYLCFQYNAFQFLKLAWCDALRPGARIQSILAKLALFLEQGVQPNGACAADCSRCRRGGPEVDFYTAVLAAALHEAAARGLLTFPEASQRCYARLLDRQKPDGSFNFSEGDYGLLADRRSYPRQQVMTLFHLLYGCGLGNGFEAAAPAAGQVTASR